MNDRIDDCIDLLVELTNEVKTMRTEQEELRKGIDRINNENTRRLSRWCRGDLEAAHYVGYKSTNTFRAWAEKWCIFQRIEDGLNLWDKGDLDKAADKAKKGLKR